VLIPSVNVKISALRLNEAVKSGNDPPVIAVCLSALYL